MTPIAPVISLVVPAWRGDREQLLELLPLLPAGDDVQVVVVTPAGEAHGYREIAREYPAIVWVSSRPGRARQMNAGASVARGSWLLFLHVDSRLPEGWRAAVERAAAAPGVVGGSYRFRLDSGNWRARLLESGVRLRVRLLGLPYGDQALFVRRDVFERIGGYADLPLMEDVDLVRRLKQAGRLWHDRLPVLTSARRWQRDGWTRRSLVNPCLTALFRLGVSPRTLKRIYLRRPATTVGIMARAPWVPGKSRLMRRIEEADQAALRQAIFEDTLGVVRALHGASPVVICEPPEACEAVADSHKLEVIAQRPGNLGERMDGAFDDLFQQGAAAVILVGSDIPDLPLQALVQAGRWLRRPGDRAVIGPAVDGGYYLVGLKKAHPELFAGIDWGTARVLEQTLERARTSGLEVRLLPPWHDLDEWTDLERLAAAGPSAAPRTRAWLAARTGTRFSSG